MPSPELGHDSTTLVTSPPYALENLGNTELPIYEQKAALIEAMQNNQVVLVIAPTGTGKSTQIPQYALEAGFDRVQMSQPRRPAAVNVAERVLHELGLSIGEEPASELVSYHTGAGLIGLYDARAQVLTEGVLRFRDTYDPTHGDNEVWVLDEVHEGSNEMWMLSGFAKQRIAENPNFTVVVMTATPNKYEAIDYWTTPTGIEPAVIELEGGTNYEIEERPEPESTTVKEAVKAALDIHENPDAHDGANTIQVFEAGKAEIKETIDSILAQLPPEVRVKTRILPNHARLSPRERALVYQDFDGIKIVVQTNIGKTSMTMPRTRYVISSGEERMMEFDEDGFLALVKRPSSQDCITQQKGRAGRTSTGIFILTRHKGEEFVPVPERPAHLQPEITRSNLDMIVMGLALRGESIRDFDANPAPPKESVDRSIHRLQILGALDDHEQLTRLGRRMAKYPVCPEHQRCLVEAEQYSEQIRLSMAAMVASAEVGGLRLFKSGSPLWEKLTDEKASDMFVHLEMFMGMQRNRLKAEVKDDLDIQNVLRAEELYRKITRRGGFEQVPQIKIPSAVDRRILHDCIVRGFAHSAYLPAGDQLFKAVGGAVILREISNRSVVSRDTRNAVVGMPYGIEVEKDGYREIKSLLGTVTEVPIKELGKYLVHQTTWQHADYKLRGGKFVQVQQQLLGRRVLSRREVPAEPTPQLRAAVIEHVKVKPSKHLLELYKIKSELEQLDRRSKYPIPLLTQDAVDSLIEQAAPDNVSDPGHVDDNLRKLIDEQKITLDSFLSPEQRQKILQDAPDEIVIDDFSLKLRYSKRKPIVKRATVEMLEGLRQEPMLPDGRQIYFQNDGKRYTLEQLKRLLHATGEL